MQIKYFLDRIIGIQTDLLFSMHTCNACVMTNQQPSYTIINSIRNNCYFDGINVRKHVHSNIKSCIVLLIYVLINFSCVIIAGVL